MDKKNLTLSTPSLTFAEFIKANRLRNENAAAYSECVGWIISDWMTALMGEVGELANEIKKVRRGDHPLEGGRAKMSKELADIQTYLTLVADALGIDLEEATIDKWNEKSEQIGSHLRIDPDLKRIVIVVPAGASPFHEAPVFTGVFEQMHAASPGTGFIKTAGELPEKDAVAEDDGERNVRIELSIPASRLREMLDGPAYTPAHDIEGST